MGGFSVITGNQFGTVMNADNASFDGTERGGVLNSNGQLWIGSNIAPRVQRGMLTSPTGTVTIGYAAPNITLDIPASSAIQTLTVDTSSGSGTNPVLPNGAGTITISGGQVAASVVGTNVIRTDSLAANAFTIQIQRSQAVAASTIADNGVSHFNSADFTVDANGFVSLLTGPPVINFAVDTSTAPGTNPVLPNGSGTVTITGGQVAAGGVGTNVIRTDSLAANTYTIQIQRSQAVAASTVADNGVSHFNSAQFVVDGNGFVSINGAAIGETITGDTGGPLSPTAGNWNILGRSGSKTSGAVSTLTIKSPPYADAAVNATSTLNSGSFATAAITLTTPASVGLADGDSLEFVATNGVLVIQLTGTQVAHIGNQVTSTTGTLTSTLTGDALILRYEASANAWWTTSVIGTWLLA
jgi:hypothetical protein